MNISAFEGTVTLQVRFASAADLSTLQQAYQILEGKNLIVSSEKSSKKSHARSDKDDVTNERILSALRKEFEGKGSFRTAQALSHIKRTLKLSRSTVGNALRYGMSKGILKKRSKGVFSFDIIDTRKPTNEGIVELHTNHVSVFQEVFKLAERVSPACFIYFSKDGITCRVSDEKNACLADIEIAKELFSIYRVDTPVSIAIDSKALLERIKNQSQLTLGIKSLNTQELQIGEFNLKVAHIEELKGAADPLTITHVKGEIKIARSQLEQVLESAKANANFIDITYDSEKVVLSNVSPSGDDWRHKVPENWTVSAAGRTRYISAFVLRAIKSQIAQAPHSEEAQGFDRRSTLD